MKIQGRCAAKSATALEVATKFYSHIYVLQNTGRTNGFRKIYCNNNRKQEHYSRIYCEPLEAGTLFAHLILQHTKEARTRLCAALFLNFFRHVYISAYGEGLTAQRGGALPRFFRGAQKPNTARNTCHEASTQPINCRENVFLSTRAMYQVPVCRYSGTRYHLINSILDHGQTLV